MSSIVTGSADATLPQDHAELLIELAVAVHKNAIYPGTHPLLVAAVDSLARRLSMFLEQTPTLSIGVARRQLIIEGVATDEEHPILRDFAARLHRHQIGAMRFSRGLEKEELAEVLATVAIDGGRVEQPLGLMGPEVLQRWRNARLFPLTFDQLELINDGLDDVAVEGEDAREARTRAAQLWIGLARAALAREATAGDLPATDPDTVARAIDAHKDDSAYDQIVVGYMLQIADELNTEEKRASSPLRDRVSRLVRQMEPRTLQRLLTMGGDASQRFQFALNASHGLSVDAVIDVVRAAADVSGQSISTSLVRMLSKLAAHAERPAGGTVQARSESELRDQVRRLISSWELADPNPDDYTAALDSISRHQATLDSDDVGEADAERMLQLALEVSTIGPNTERIFNQMLARPDVTPLLDLLDGAPEGGTRDTLMARVVTAERLIDVLHSEQPNTRLAERLALRLGAVAVDPVINLLEDEEERLHGWACDMLVRLPDAGGRVVERLIDSPVQAQRQMLHVVDRLGEWPEGFSPEPFTASPDASVRREAVKLMLRRDELRDAAIVVGLDDQDERTIGIALAAALKRCPLPAVPILMRRVESSTLSGELRARGIRALAASGSMDAMRWIAQRSVKKHWLLRTPVLREKSPQLISSIAGLAAHWSSAPEAAEVLALVAKSKDADLRSAAARSGAA